MNSPFHEGLFGIASSYRFRSVNLAGVYQRIENTDNSEDTLVGLAGDLDLTPLNSVRLAVTFKRDGGNSDLDEVYVIFGGDHRFSEHFMAFVEFFRKSTKVPQPGDEFALISGFRFDF